MGGFQMNNGGQPNQPMQNQLDMSSTNATQSPNNQSALQSLLDPNTSQSFNQQSNSFSPLTGLELTNESGASGTPQTDQNQNSNQIVNNANQSLPVNNLQNQTPAPTPPGQPQSPKKQSITGETTENPGNSLASDQADSTANANRPGSAKQAGANANQALSTVGTGGVDDKSVNGQENPTIIRGMRVTLLNLSESEKDNVRNKIEQIRPTYLKIDTLIQTLLRFGGDREFDKVRKLTGMKQMLGAQLDVLHQDIYFIRPDTLQQLLPSLNQYFQYSDLLVNGHLRQNGGAGIAGNVAMGGQMMMGNNTSMGPPMNGGQQMVGNQMMGNQMANQMGNVMSQGMTNMGNPNMMNQMKNPMQMTPRGLNGSPMMAAGAMQPSVNQGMNPNNGSPHMSPAMLQGSPNVRPMPMVSPQVRPNGPVGQMARPMNGMNQAQANDQNFRMQQAQAIQIRQLNIQQQLQQLNAMSQGGAMSPEQMMTIQAKQQELLRNQQMLQSQMMALNRGQVMNPRNPNMGMVRAPGQMPQNGMMGGELGMHPNQLQARQMSPQQQSLYIQQQQQLQRQQQMMLQQQIANQQQSQNAPQQLEDLLGQQPQTDPNQQFTLNQGDNASQQGSPAVLNNMSVSKPKSPSNPVENTLKKEGTPKLTPNVPQNQPGGNGNNMLQNNQFFQQSMGMAGNMMNQANLMNQNAMMAAMNANNNVNNQNSANQQQMANQNRMMMNQNGMNQNGMSMVQNPMNINGNNMNMNGMNMNMNANMMNMMNQGAVPNGNQNNGMNNQMGNQNQNPMSNMAQQNKSPASNQGNTLGNGLNQVGNGANPSPITISSTPNRPSSATNNATESKTNATNGSDLFLQNSVQGINTQGVAMSREPSQPKSSISHDKWMEGFDMVAGTQGADNKDEDSNLFDNFFDFEYNPDAGTGTDSILETITTEPKKEKRGREEDVETGNPVDKKSKVGMATLESELQQLKIEHSLTYTLNTPKDTNVVINFEYKTVSFALTLQNVSLYEMGVQQGMITFSTTQSPDQLTSVVADMLTPTSTNRVTDVVKVVIATLN
ncbi:hypothetical protein BC833DRAFT_24134 [Globomyces pollinis-pini]|nr:hypothetical protein BC833DRAFT_24134 [Globomyces pollinis-pini]